MSYRDIGTDDPRVKVRPGKNSRPRTKIRPDYSHARRGRVTTVDRGRYHVTMNDDATQVIAVKARELPRGSVVVGDVCAMVGDLSGKKDTLARIASVDPRTSVLRRTAEDGDTSGTERIIVANADQLCIVVSLAQPEPKFGLIDRCLVAAYDAGMQPVLILTKSDLADEHAIVKHYAGLDLQIITSALPGDANPTGATHRNVARYNAAYNNTASGGATQENTPNNNAIHQAENNQSDTHQSNSHGNDTQCDSGTHPYDHMQRVAVPDHNNTQYETNITAITSILHGHVSVFVGHSGVGKSTLINALVPHAKRETGHVNEVTGNGRHTSTSAMAFDLDGGGVVIDTPGVRSFGLAHVAPVDVLRGFPDLQDIARECPRGCSHSDDEIDCAFEDVNDPHLRIRIESFRRLMISIDKPAWA